MRNALTAALVAALISVAGAQASAPPPPPVVPMSNMTLTKRVVEQGYKIKVLQRRDARKQIQIAELKRAVAYLLCRDEGGTPLGCVAR